MNYPLADLCEIITKGTTPTTLGMNFSESGVRFIRVNNFGEGDLRLDKHTLYISEETHSSLSRSNIHPGDVLLSIAGTIGRSCVVPDDCPALNCNQAVCVIRPKTELLSNHFLQRWLTSSSALSQMLDGKVTGVISNLSLTKVRELEIPLPYKNGKPDLDEQKRIAAILDKADGIRRKRQQALRLTDDFLRSVFLDMFGDPVTNPMGWDNGTLGDLVERLDGGKNIAESTSETTYRVLKVSAVTYGDYRPHESKFVPDDFNVPESYLVKTGDLLVSRANTRELIGATAFVWDTPPNIMLPDKVWKFVWRDHDTTDPLFVHALTRFPGIQAEIGKRASGSSGSMKNIAKPKLLSLPIPIPPPEKQKAFGDIARKLHTTRKRFADTTTSPEDLFSSLQQRAFRGEL